MSETTTFEEAKLCPKCGQPGDDRATKKVRKGREIVDVHMIYCVSQLCPWYNTMWVVQVNADGSIPPKNTGANSDKLYPKISQESATKIEENILRQLEAETSRDGTAEVRNPKG